jgi:RNA polymerase sigma-70 factor (ECF subfamily)
MTATRRPTRASILERSVKYEDVAPRLEEHRAALTAHCRWVLGSASEAEDAVQETMLRAWQRFAEFEGRSSLRAWLRRIAHNVCLDMLRAPQRRARPADPGAAGPAGPADTAAAVPGAPVARAGRPATEDPAERAVASEGVHQALVAALLHLPPRQRSALLLCEVMRWQASEAAELLGTTVASVTSSLQRARASVEAFSRGSDPSAGLDDDQQALVARCVRAFERHDVGSLADLLTRTTP